MIIDLKNKNALVCGSTGGIGKASALELAKAGANVTLLARNADKLSDVLKELDTSQGQQHHFIQADFSDTENVKHAIQNFMKEGYTFQILLNNTGGPPGGAIATAQEEDFLKALNAHLLCNHILAQAVIPAMREKNYGRIINIISTSVKIPLKGLGVSNTTRGAVANWSKTLAGELAPSGITVNNVLPGATKTGRLSGIIKTKAEKASLDINKVEEEMLSEIPMGRFGTPEELAYAVVFLASQQAAYITGSNIVVDGGRTGCL